MNSDSKPLQINSITENGIKRTRREFLFDSAKTVGLLVASTALVSFINSCTDSSNPVSISGTGQKVTIDLR